MDQYYAEMDQDYLDYLDSISTGSTTAEIEAMALKEAENVDYLEFT